MISHSKINKFIVRGINLFNFEVIGDDSLARTIIYDVIKAYQI